MQTHLDSNMHLLQHFWPNQPLCTVSLVLPSSEPNLHLVTCVQLKSVPHQTIFARNICVCSGQGELSWLRCGYFCTLDTHSFPYILRLEGGKEQGEAVSSPFIYYKQFRCGEEQSCKTLEYPWLRGENGGQEGSKGKILCVCVCVRWYLFSPQQIDNFGLWLGCVLFCCNNIT